MSLLNDPRDEYFEHFGVKGMKWGVRKAIYKRQKELAAKSRGHARDINKTVKDIESGKTPEQKSTSQKLKDAADEFDGLDDRKAKELRRVAKDIESGGRLSEQSMKDVRAMKEASKHLQREARSWEKAAAESKVKMDKLREEMDRKPTPKEVEARNRKIAVGAFIVGAGIMAAATSMPAMGSTKTQATPDIVNEFFSKVKT